MIRRYLSDLLSVIVQNAREAVEHIRYGKAEPGAPVRLDAECPDHGRTFVLRSRTACCNSAQWVPAGNVDSRIPQRLSGACRAWTYSGCPSRGAIDKTLRLRSTERDNGLESADRLEAVAVIEWPCAVGEDGVFIQPRSDSNVVGAFRRITRQNDSDAAFALVAARRDRQLAESA